MTRTRKSTTRAASSSIRVNESFRLQDIVDRALADLPDSFDPELSRYYAFDGDTLRLSIRDRNGRETATTIWTRRN